MTEYNSLTILNTNQSDFYGSGSSHSFTFHIKVRQNERMNLTLFCYVYLPGSLELHWPMAVPLTSLRGASTVKW